MKWGAIGSIVTQFMLIVACLQDYWIYSYKTQISVRL